MKEKARINAALELLGAADRKLERARTHLYECDKEAMMKLIAFSTELNAVQAKLKKRKKELAKN